MTELGGALMVCGTASDAGKTTIVTGLCRSLARRGVRVAPFKAQNMALNSAVTADGHEIGRAQAAQAEAAGVEPEVAMNPILLKPESDRRSQVVVMGRPWATLDAAEYQAAKPSLRTLIQRQLDELAARFDVVILEGAGSPAEINLLDGDIVNLGVARDIGSKALIVGDIDRGGVFASLYGTVGLLPPDLRSTVGGFIINKFRGDPTLLANAPADLEARTGIPTLGVLPWIPDIGLEAEDSLALRHPWPTEPTAAIDVAVIRLPHISNFTDVDPLALEPDISIRLVDRAASLGHPDLVVLPGTKSTAADLEWLRNSGIAGALTKTGASTTILGICGGYQMLGQTVEDPHRVESRQEHADGLALLPSRTTFQPAKTLRRTTGTALGASVSGYEIHHGTTTHETPWIAHSAGEEGSRSDNGQVFGTSWHGILEQDPFRHAFLHQVAARAGKAFRPGTRSFQEARQDRFDLIAGTLEAHLDMAAIDALIKEGQRP